MTKVLTAAEITAALRGLQSWTFQDGALRATYTFADFAAAFAFMTKVAAEAERANHHPTWRNVWSKVEIALSTHDAGGVTEKDVALAKRIAAAATSNGSH